MDMDILEEPQDFVVAASAGLVNLLPVKSSDFYDKAYNFDIDSCHINLSY